MPVCQLTSLCCWSKLIWLAAHGTQCDWTQLTKLLIGCQGSHLYLYLVPRDIVHPTNEAKKLKKKLLENSFQITSLIKSLDIASAVAADHANWDTNLALCTWAHIKMSIECMSLLQYPIFPIQDSKHKPILILFCFPGFSLYTCSVNICKLHAKDKKLRGKQRQVKES